MISNVKYLKLLLIFLYNLISGAVISTRGRYIHPEDKRKTGDRPLYLYIQGLNKQSLDC